MRVFIYITLMLLVACSSGMPESYQPLPQAVPVTPFTMYNQDAQTVDHTVFKDKWSLVFFGYTYCPDVCPTTLAEINRAARDIQLDNLQVVLVSVDPERDNPKQLKGYIEYFNKTFQAWSGELPDIQNLARQMHVFFQKTPHGESYLMDHSSQVVLVNPAGEYMGFFTAPLQTQEISDYMNSFK